MTERTVLPPLFSAGATCPCYPRTAGPSEHRADALAGGEMIPLELVDDCQALVIALKRAYRRMDVHQVKSLCNTVSIGILLADAPNTERKAA